MESYLLYLFLLLIVALAGKIGGQHCAFQILQCVEDFPADSPRYEFDSSQSGISSDQRICFSTNTDQYDARNTTISLRPSIADNGAYCTDKPLDVSEACQRNISGQGRTIMHVNISSLFNESGVISVNFTIKGMPKQSDILKATFMLTFNPDGIYHSIETPLNVVPGSTLDLRWTIYGTESVNYQHLDRNSKASSLVPGDFNMQPLTGCIIPDPSVGNPPVLPNMTRVLVSAVNFEDSGSFTLSNAQFSSTILVNVQVNQAPIILPTTSSTLVERVGATITLNCNVQWSSQPPNWYFNGVPITSDGTNYLIQTESLRILTAQQSDSGEYTCTASNEFGRTERSFPLIIGVPPQITVRPANITVMSGSSVVLPCTVISNPPSNITWFVINKGNSTMLIDGVGGIAIDSVTNALRTPPISEEQVLYFCRATNLNKFGSIQTPPASVNTIITGNNISSSLTYSIGSTGEVSTYPFIVLSNDQFAVINCDNSTLTNINFQWYKDNQLLPGITSVNITVMATQNGSQWGYYCCKMLDGVSSMLIDERCVSVSIRVPATIENGLTNTSVNSNSDVFFYCSANTANGIDLPSLNWYKNDVLLNESSPRYSYTQQRFGLTTLKIQNVTISDSGMYTCRGINFVSTASSSAQLNVIDECTSNILQSSSAEGDESTVTSHWQSNADSFITNTGGDTHFTLNTPSQTIRQIINLTENNANYTVTFSGRMRTSLPESSQPYIELIMSGTSNTSISLPFPSLDSWQWVTSASIVQTTSLPAMLTVVMSVKTNSSLSAGAVYFDDLCLSITSQALIAPTSTMMESTHTNTIGNTPSPTGPISIIPIVLLAAVSGTGGVILLTVLLCGSLCICCLCYKRKRTKSISPNSLDLTKRNSKLGYTTELAQHPMFMESTLKNSNSSQPVYVMPGQTPVYLTNAASYKMETPLTTSQENNEGYDYPNMKEHKLSSATDLIHEFENKTHSDTTYLEVREDPLKKAEEGGMYEDPNKPVEGSMYDDPNKPVEGTYEDPNKPVVEDMYDDPNKPVEGTYDDPNKPVEGTYEDPNKPVEGTYEDPNKPVEGTYEDPNKPVEDVYEDPNKPVEDVYEDPNRMNDNSYEDPNMTNSEDDYELPILRLDSIGAVTQPSRKKSATPDSTYMSLNPSSINKHLYASTSSLVKATDDGEEKCSINDDYCSVSDSKLDQVRRKLSNVNTTSNEDDYI